MINFIHRKHIHESTHVRGIVIYYSLSDIVLGFLLIVLVSFFIFSYLRFSFGQLSHAVRPPIEIHSTSPKQAQ